MPRVKPLAQDKRIEVLRILEIRQGYKNHTDMARRLGIPVSTITKRFREPGSITLDELARMTRGSATGEEAQILISGGGK